MLPSNTNDSISPTFYQTVSRTYIYYSRYPAVKPINEHFSWHKVLRRMGLYARLTVIGVMMTIIGGVFPLIISYDLFFKPIILANCNSCLIIGAQPYFEIDYIIATILGVMGFMMPIFVLYIFMKIITSRTMRHDLFH